MLAVASASVARGGFAARVSEAAGHVATCQVATTGLLSLTYVHKASEKAALEDPLARFGMGEMPVEEAHLLFAGDFVASERPGTIEGAALSAMDAADKLAILLAAGGPRL